jgi:iron complex transport system substrate-binding protein
VERLLNPPLVHTPGPRPFPAAVSLGGRGVDGLETGLAGSINLGVLDKVGGVNVAATAGSGGLTRVSLEQILAWDPDLIVTLEPVFYKSVGTDPAWSSVTAVRHKRIYLAPRLPHGWVDASPAVNRLIGVRRLMSILYPKEFPEHLRDTTKNFYRLFHHVDLSEAQIDTLLATAVPAR